jgi:hypothetical protein
MLLDGSLKVIAGQTVRNRIVRKGIGTPGIINVLKLYEDLRAVAVTQGYGFGDVDRVGIEVGGIENTDVIDRTNFEDVAAIRAKPAAE